MEVNVRIHSVTDVERLALSVTELARTTGTCPGFVRQEIARGALKAAKVGSRVLIPVEAVRAWLGLGAPTSARGRSLTASAHTQQQSDISGVLGDLE